MIVVAIAVAVAFDFTNGFHDSSNALAALVATRAARPGPAVVLVGVCHVAGPLIAGTAVANTVGGIVRVSAGDTIAVVGAGLTGAIAWNLVTWWRGLPSSSSHALVGGLVGAAVLHAGRSAVQWGGFESGRPVGVLGVLATLAISPVLGFVVAFAAARVARRGLRRARRGVGPVLRRGEWATAAALAFSHGANDAQKTMGVMTVLLVADGHLSSFVVPLWVKLLAAASLTFGTLVGGWRIVRTLGRGIYRLRSQDGLVSQGVSAATILGSAAVGGPVSTTHVVASSVMGVGAGQHRRHVRWAVVREIVMSWLLTLPAAAVAGMLALTVWRELA
ncbi:MAG TPA: inorganic phosphate transporter [Acidimicrobiales bacterium]|nr:inorganic phosphate transporter [Acidimicrobiales bacterium]